VRIGVLTTSWPRPDDEAAGGFVAGFARWLAAHVGDVEVLRADPRRPLFADGGAPSRLRDPRRWGEAGSFTARLVAEAARRARRWDAIVSHWLVPSGIAAAAVAAGRPHLTIAHGSDARLLAALPGGALIARAIARRAELVYVAEALAIEGAVGRVVPMGVDVAALRGGDRAATRAELDARDAPVALFLGRLVDDKGADALVAAAARVTDAWRVVIAGEGPARPALERRLAAASPSVRSRVRLVGRVDAHRRRALLAAADVLVLPSRHEGAPQVVAEAQAAALPVIATAVGGIPALVGDAGLLLAPPRTRRPGDDPALVAALAAGLDRLARDPSLRTRLAAAAAARGDAHDWSVVGPRLWPDRWPRRSSPVVQPEHGAITIITV
jgi:glycosyltransferase involved in cell wall biosynthesis